MRLLSLVPAALFAVLMTLVSTDARADHLVVARHVTVRVEPARQSDVVVFPDIGSALDLRSDAVSVRGYYPVRLSDGRSGWVYRTFVRRRSGPPPWAVATATGPKITVHYIDVDQGAATLVETSCGAILIDAGGRDAAAGEHLIAYLQAFFARRSDLNQTLAAVFVTHTHIDHNRFLRRVAETFPVRGYIHNGRLNGSGWPGARWMVDHAGAVPSLAVQAVSTADVQGASPDGLGGPVIDPLNCGDGDPKIRVLGGQYLENPGWPDGEFDNGNNHSLIVRIDYGEASFLFTGDLEEAAIETLVERYGASDMLDVDVYAVGHHGSYNGTTRSLLEKMSPEAAVISMGRPAAQVKWSAWAYGHPRRVVVNELVEGVSGSRTARSVAVADGAKRFSTMNLSRAIYATGWDGDVVIRAGANGALDFGN